MFSHNRPELHINLNKVELNQSESQTNQTEKKLYYN